MQRPILKPHGEGVRGGWCWIKAGTVILLSQPCLGSNSNLDTSQLSRDCKGMEKNRHIYTFYFCTMDDSLTRK